MNSHGSNNKLPGLAQQLRLYNYSLRRDEELAAKQQHNYGYKVINLTHMGFQESVITSSHPRWFEPRRAAVLVCIFEGDCGEFRVLLTERSSRLSAHPAEEGDKDDRDTATRETNEEIGLDPSLVDVIAVLPPFLCKHLPKVIPVVGILRNRKAFTAALNPAEVQVLFDAPLQMFIQVGLSNYITSQSLEKLFAPFGVIEQARLVVDPRTKKPKGFGFVRFQSETDAQKALKALNGRIVDGRLIFVEVAETTKPGD
ncbi:Nudix hydrolase 22, chloroplastic [Linum grandiflorum]